MKTIGLCLLVWAWIGHGWYFAIVGWIIFEYRSLNESVYNARKDGKIQTVCKTNKSELS